MYENKKTQQLQLNYQYTALMLAFSAITLAATQYLGKPIQCWVPPEFTGAWERYILYVVKIQN
jgi:hypothetical protein